MGITIFTLVEGRLRASTELDDISDLLEAQTLFWLDATVRDEPLRALLSDKLKLHPLVVEDVLQERLHPKVEDFGEYLYLVVHGVRCTDADPEHIETVEVDLLITSHWVLSHRPETLPAADEVREEFRRNPKLFERGPAFIAHAIIDHLVDGYLPVMDAFDEAADAVEQEAVGQPKDDLLPRIFRLKRAIYRMRRMATHQREVLQRLARGEFDLIPERAVPFYRDIHDHFVRVVDLSEGYRELLSGALDAYLTTVSNRMNSVMKTLTGVSVVMLPLTFIAGVYGMNFDHMPELHWKYGYLWAIGLMAATVVTMVWWFRRKGLM
jgi:magnesium transporter